MGQEGPVGQEASEDPVGLEASDGPAGQEEEATQEDRVAQEDQAVQEDQEVQDIQAVCLDQAVCLVMVLEGRERSAAPSPAVRLGTRGRSGRGSTKRCRAGERADEVKARRPATPRVEGR